MSLHLAQRTFVAALLTLVCFTAFTPDTRAQAIQSKQPKGQTAVVIDERLSILRFEPSLSAVIFQRLSHGREVKVLGAKKSDGVVFYRVLVPPSTRAWIQSEAVVSTVRKGDDERLFNLIMASDGMDKIERARIFLEVFHISSHRPAVLLIFGDAANETAEKLSRDIQHKFDEREVAASGAPAHSFYWNFKELDKFRRQGMNFTFNMDQKKFCYDGAEWREVIQRFPNSTEAAEARKRLDLLLDKAAQK